MDDSKKGGGADQNRTGDRGFADRSLSHLGTAPQQVNGFLVYNEKPPLSRDGNSAVSPVDRACRPQPGSLDPAERDFRTHSKRVYTIPPTSIEMLVGGILLHAFIPSSGISRGPLPGGYPSGDRRVERVALS